MPPRGCVPRLERWLARHGARIERVRYARPDARGDVEAWRITPAEPRGRVVVAHGAGNDALYPQLPLFKTLLLRGMEIFSFDIDGHGAASTTVFAPDVVPGALAAAVAEAEDGRPDLPLHLLGHSFGGSLVLHALAEGTVPHALSAVVISAPVSVRLDLRVALAELRGFLRAETLGQREHYGLWGTVPAVGPLKRRVYPIRGAAEEGAPFAYVAAIQRLLAALELETAAPRITTPVLLAYGTADRLVPIEQARTLASLIPTADLFEIPGATHWTTAIAAASITRAADWISAHTVVHA
ncbi:MAG: alpha/beta fold hydrolase [Gemmatimonadetes bacterium]|nr:alpha/beta fold hydrolase [Gemmatimonadota bacterium]